MNNEILWLIRLGLDQKLFTREQALATVKAIGRAGTGVNNIPVEAMSKRGVPVFNAPGANANAVKELVLAGMLIAARNVVPAVEYDETGEPIVEFVTLPPMRSRKQVVGV